MLMRNGIGKAWTGSRHARPAPLPSESGMRDLDKWIHDEMSMKIEREREGAREGYDEAKKAKHKGPRFGCGIALPDHEQIRTPAVGLGFSVSCRGSRFCHHHEHSRIGERRAVHAPTVPFIQQTPPLIRIPKEKEVKVFFKTGHTLRPLCVRTLKL